MPKFARLLMLVAATIVYTATVVWLMRDATLSLGAMSALIVMIAIAALIPAAIWWIGTHDFKGKEAHLGGIALGSLVVAVLLAMVGLDWLLEAVGQMSRRLWLTPLLAGAFVAIVWIGKLSRAAVTYERPRFKQERTSSRR